MDIYFFVVDDFKIVYLFGWKIYLIVMVKYLEFVFVCGNWGEFDFKESCVFYVVMEGEFF